MVYSTCTGDKVISHELDMLETTLIEVFKIYFVQSNIQLKAWFVESLIFFNFFIYLKCSILPQGVDGIQLYKNIYTK